jgi:hypothetical protein
MITTKIGQYVLNIHGYISMAGYKQQILNDYRQLESVEFKKKVILLEYSMLSIK